MNRKAVIKPFISVYIYEHSLQNKWNTVSHPHQSTWCECCGIKGTWKFQHWISLWNCY